MRYINELREGEVFSEIYLCKQVQTLKTKAGKSYMALTLQDKTGTADAKIWELGSGKEKEAALVLSRSLKKGKAAFDGGEKDVEAMLKEIRAIAASVTNPHLKQLLGEFFENKAFLSLFRKHSAAKSVHHAFIGGLLEHTLSVTQVCEFYAKQYPILNRDLLVTAAMFHDIGKLKELSEFPENDYTDEGNLLGHIYMGAEMVGRKIEAIPGFPKTLAAELKHCILAHHGELEFGSPKKPALCEALALSMADNLDAKMETLRELMRDGSNTAVNGWLGFQRLLDSNIRITEV